MHLILKAIYFNALTLKSTETDSQRCSVKKVFLEISPNSQENTCTRVSFLKTLQALGLWHRCFPVNFAKFLRSPFFIEHLWWLLLKVTTLRWLLCQIDVQKQLFADVLQTRYSENIRNIHRKTPVPESLF